MSIQFSCLVVSDSLQPLRLQHANCPSPVHHQLLQLAQIHVHWVSDAEAEAPVLWPPHVKNWLTGKDPDAGKDWRRQKGMTEDLPMTYQKYGSENYSYPGCTSPTWSQSRWIDINKELFKYKESELFCKSHGLPRPYKRYSRRILFNRIPPTSQFSKPQSPGSLFGK